MKKKLILLGVFLGLGLLAIRFMNRSHPDYSPPGFSYSYFPMSPIIKVTKYDEYQSWYETDDGSYLFLTFKHQDEYKFITISKWTDWYCVRAIPDYCAPLRGINGKEVNQPSQYTWPKE